MRIATNKNRSIIKFFRDELKDLYDTEEIENFIFYSFHHFLGFSRLELLTKVEDTVTESELLKFNNVVKELKKHKPIQYILGFAYFYGMDLEVNESVLIPRPETEELVDLILKENKERKKLSVLDIGTGSGCIAIALTKNLSEATVISVDISEEALATAKNNAVKQGVDIDFKKFDVLESNLNELKTNFDIIVSNPPYVLFSEKDTMETNVLDHEPHLALFVPDNDPLIFYRRIAEAALDILAREGRLYFEINEKMGDETKSLLERIGFKNILLHKDINGKNRILSCTKF